MLDKKRNPTVRDAGHRPIAARDTEELGAALANELPKLRIPRCPLALYPAPAAVRTAGTPCGGRGPGRAPPPGTRARRTRTPGGGTHGGAGGGQPGAHRAHRRTPARRAAAGEP